MRVQMVPASAPGGTTTSIAQPQRAANRRWDAATRAADIEDLAGLPNLDVHARTIAGEHASDMQRDRCAVAQVTADAGSAMLELAFRGHEHQFVARAQGTG